MRSNHSVEASHVDMANVMSPTRGVSYKNKTCKIFDPSDEQTPFQP